MCPAKKAKPAIIKKRPKTVNPVRADRFTREVIAGVPIREAALKVGYKHPNTGANLMQQPAVRKAILAEQERWLAKMDMKIGDVLEELRCVAFANIAELYRDGKLQQIDDLPEHVQRSIKSITVCEQGDDSRIIKYELWDKLGAVNQIGKHFGMFIERAQVDINHRHYHQHLPVNRMPPELQMEILEQLSVETRTKMMNAIRSQGGSGDAESQNGNGAGRHAVAIQDRSDEDRPLEVPGRPQEDPVGDGDAGDE